MTKPNKLLLGVLLFNAVTALIGGLGLIFGFIKPPSAWLPHVFFHSYVLPGLILFFIVGGSAVHGAVSLMRMTSFAYEIAGLSGLLMVAWIVGEILVIQQTNWLQFLYLLTGSVVVIAASRFTGIKSARRA